MTTAGIYRHYEDIVVEVAREVGLSDQYATRLFDAKASGKLLPWPETTAVLAKLAGLSWRTAVVTNCSPRLVEAAAAATKHRFAQIVSAERAGICKIEPGAYRAGLAALGETDPSSVLFVTGSARDVPGAGAVGMPVYWSNHFNDQVPKARLRRSRTSRICLRFPSFSNSFPRPTERRANFQVAWRGFSQAGRFRSPACDGWSASHAFIPRSENLGHLSDRAHSLIYLINAFYITILLSRERTSTLTLQIAAHQ